MKITSLFAISALISITAPVFCTPAAISTLDNGLTVIIAEDHSVELAGVDVWVKAGSARETTKNNGAAHLIEHLVFAATKNREPGQVDMEIESLGATLDAHTSRDWAHFNTTVPSRYLPQAIELISDALLNPLFRQADLAEERQVLLDEIAAKEADPFKICKDIAAELLYGEHPYALPVEGTVESIKKITRDEIADFHAAWYVPANIAVIVVGDVDSAKVLEIIKTSFGSIPKSPAPKHDFLPLNPPKQREKHVNGPFSRTYIAICYAGPDGKNYGDVCATDALLSYLGFGYRSWISDTLKAKMGLAVDGTVDFLTHRDRGAVNILATTTGDKVDECRGAIIAKISEIAQFGISDSELELAKRSLLGQFAFQNETYGGRANSYGFYFAVADPSFNDEYVKCVRNITNDDIKRVAGKYLNSEDSVFVVVGPKEVVRD